MTTQRVIVHPGFHKTGTSSLQSYCGKHRKALRPYMTFYGKAAFMQTGSAARIYGQKPYPWRLRRFRAHLDLFLAQVPDDPVIVLSRETFSGAMPGHRRLLGRMVKDYRRAAVPLGRQIVDGLRARFGEEVSIEFLYTLRDQESWIRSVYGHLLRSIHLTEDYDTFRARFPKLIDLTEEATRISDALRLDAVHLSRLEEVGSAKEGPAKALLDLVDIPQAIRAKLPPAERANSGQSPDLEQKFLELNRQGHSKAHLKRAKDALIAAERDRHP